MRRTIGGAGPFLLLLLGACATPTTPTRPPTPLVSVLPDDPSRPYVVTAIDYHFHDAHPTRSIGVGRTLIVKNQGSVRHNVTIPSIGFSKDVPPGGRIVIRDVARLLGGPGRYTFFCKLHLPQDMRGVILIGPTVTQ